MGDFLSIKPNKTEVMLEEEEYLTSHQVIFKLVHSRNK
jgi:hypothetical protein